MLQIARTLDCRDTVCPGPVIEVSKAIRLIAVHGVLEVLATDPGFIPDVRAFVTRTGHALVSAERREDSVRVLLRRTH